MLYPYLAVFVYYISIFAINLAYNVLIKHDSCETVPVECYDVLDAVLVALQYVFFFIKCILTDLF